MKAVIKKSILILAALVAALVLAIVALALLMGPVLKSPGMQRLAEETVRAATGFSCSIERIRFEFPFRITVEGITVEGQTGQNAFHVYAGHAAVLSGPEALARAHADEIRVEAVEIELEPRAEGSGQGMAAFEGRPLEIPDWVWRIREANVHIETARVRSAEGSVCFEDIHAEWTLGPEAEQGSLKIALKDPTGQGDQVTLQVSPHSISAPPGPVVLPVPDLPALVGFAGLDMPITGSLAGAAFPVSGPNGIEAVHFIIDSEDLALDEKRFNAGFSRGNLQMGGLVLMPHPRHEGFSLFMEEAIASLEGLIVAGKQTDAGLEPLDLSGSLDFDTLTDRADWALDVISRQDTLEFHTRGSLAGILAGTRLTTASVLATVSDLNAMATALSPRATLPGNAKLDGNAIFEAELSGSMESMVMKGSVRTSDFLIAAAAVGEIPILLDTALSGAFQTGKLERLRVEARRLEVGKIAAREASCVYGPDGVTAKVTFESLEAPRLVSLLGPTLPPQLADYQWDGSVHLSGNARVGLDKGSPVRGDFSARLLNGQFASPDYLRMGEGIDIDMEGTFRVPMSGSPFEVTVGAALPRGEIVMGELYGNLSRTRPRLDADLRFNAGTRALELRSAKLMLDGVGAVGLAGNLTKGPDGIRGRTKIEAGPIHLDALLERVLQDAMGGLYPEIEQMTGAGALAISTDLDVEDQAYRARGRLQLEEALVDDPSKGLSIEKVEVDLPFSLSISTDSTSHGPTHDGPVPPGTVSIEGIDFKGLEVPKIHARIRVEEDSVTLEDPMRVEFSGGSVSITEFSLNSLGSGRPKGRATASIDSLALEPIATAVAGRAIEGRLSGLFDRIALEDGVLEAVGRLDLRIRDGELLVEDIELRAPIPGAPSGRCTVRATGIPLQPITREFMQPPLEGTLDGDLSEVRLADGKIETEGLLTLSTFGGAVKLSGMRAAGFPGPTPVAQLDVDLEAIDLSALSSPLRFGRVSGVLQGRIHGLRVRQGFPYATAFDADLKTVKRRGVPRKIDATAVENIARIGGSSQLANVLSVGLYRFFDEYYYRKMGIRAILEDGWLELHGLPKGNKEYLIIRRPFRVPTLSMPITVMTRNQKIRFNRWLSDIMRIGEGR